MKGGEFNEGFREGDGAVLILFHGTKGIGRGGGGRGLHHVNVFHGQSLGATGVGRGLWV